MQLTCPRCGARYEVDPGLVPPGGRDVSCSACDQVWHVEPPEAQASAPAPFESRGPKGRPPSEVEEGGGVTDLEPAVPAGADRRGGARDGGDDARSGTAVADLGGGAPGSEPGAPSTFPPHDSGLGEQPEARELADGDPPRPDADREAMAHRFEGPQAASADSTAQPRPDHSASADAADAATGTSDGPAPGRAGAPGDAPQGADRHGGPSDGEGSAREGPQAADSDRLSGERCAKNAPSLHEGGEGDAEDDAPPDPPLPRRPLAESVRAILVEEAEREARIRQLEIRETAADPGRRAAERAERADATLRAASLRTASPDRSPPQESRRGGFALGFGLALALAAAMATLYLVAPALSRAVPRAEPLLAAYVEAANVARDGVGGTLDAAASALAGLFSSPAD